MDFNTGDKLQLSNNVSYEIKEDDALFNPDSLLDVWDDGDSEHWFRWGYFDGGRLDNPSESNPWYLMGFFDRQYEISVGIPADLEFFPDFEEF